MCVHREGGKRGRVCEREGRREMREGREGRGGEGGEGRGERGGGFPYRWSDCFSSALL